MASLFILVAVTLLLAIPILPLLGIFTFKIILRYVGRLLQEHSRQRRDIIVHQVKKSRQLHGNGSQTSEGEKDASDSQTAEWSGIVGFFHPFCNAGGGGERVLWAAIAATQKKWPNAICAVYTGDHDIDKGIMVKSIKDRFGITIQEPTLRFLYLSTRHWLLAVMYEHFTLLGQSMGSLIVAFDAFYLLVPDIFIDTMGYAFATALCKYLFPSVPTGAYVHYPTISTDMLESLDDKSGLKGVNAGAGVGFRGTVKKTYWHIFAWMYGWVGRRIDVVMCNSTWTYGHISQLWRRSNKNKTSPDHSNDFATVLYPPCPVEELISKVKVDEESELNLRQNIILYIAQYRPEKNHSLILRSFAKFYHSQSNKQTQHQNQKPSLVLIGSVRSDSPDERHIYNLRLEAHELKITEATTFIIDVPFSLIQTYLQKSSVSVNGMYAEHFGIGNVEGLAAGLIPVVHDSGGPKLDIVIPYQGEKIGFHASTDDQYADAFEEVLCRMTPSQKVEMRRRGRMSSLRFTEEEFERSWILRMRELMVLQIQRSNK